MFEFNTASNSPKFDAGWKILGTFLLILLVVSMENLIYLETAFLTAIAIAMLLGIPVANILKRLRLPLFVAVVVSIVHPFTYGTTILYSLPFLNIYTEGAIFGARIFLRVMASVTLLNILIMTTPLREVLLAFRRLGIPKVITDVTFLMFRFASIFSREASVIQKAQRSRLAYSGGYFDTASSYGQMAGKLILKSIDRSVKVHRAMLSRGHEID